jgi:hypothetical protein
MSARARGRRRRGAEVWVGGHGARGAGRTHRGSGTRRSRGCTHRCRRSTTRRPRTCRSIPLRGDFACSAHVQRAPKASLLAASHPLSQRRRGRRGAGVKGSRRDGRSAPLGADALVGGRAFRDAYGVRVALVRALAAEGAVGAIRGIEGCRLRNVKAGGSSPHAARTVIG